MPTKITFKKDALEIACDDSVALLRKRNLTATEQQHYFCCFKISAVASAEDILRVIFEAKQAIEHYLQEIHTNSRIYWQPLDNLNLNKDDILVELHPTRKMHQVIRNASFAHKLEYVKQVGLIAEISRQNDFRDVERFMWLQNQVRAIGIPVNFANGNKVRRIHAVHSYYIHNDEEVREELKVTHAKHAQDNSLYVASQSALCYALAICEPGATLVINGHWEHNKHSVFGIWDRADAETMARNITDAVNAFPGKIAHINLLGCQSGSVAPELRKKINMGNLFFKYHQQPYKKLRAMGTFRNRAIYVSRAGESIFHSNSLAFLVLERLNDKTIAVSAPPSLDYPYPPENPQFNIGSDNPNWKSVYHYWNSEPGPTIFGKLITTKSITQIDASVCLTHSKRPWILR